MNALLKPLLDALASAVKDPSNPIVGFAAKWLLHALGDKTTTFLATVFAWFLAHSDVTAAIGGVLPANVSHYVALALPYLMILFGGYLTTPKKGADLAVASGQA